MEIALKGLLDTKNQFEEKLQAKKQVSQAKLDMLSRNSQRLLTQAFLILN